MLESQFQKNVTDYLKFTIPDCLIMKNDPRYIQGIPDWIVITPKGWALLEIKISDKAHHQPNQDYYINMYNNWGTKNNVGCAYFICPENIDIEMPKILEILQ